MGGYVDGRPKEPTVDDLDLLERCDVETMRADLHKAEELHRRIVKADDARSDPYPCRFPHCRHHHGDPFYMTKQPAIAALPTSQSMSLPQPYRQQSPIA
jgi:hypothetical protein